MGSAAPWQRVVGSCFPGSIPRLFLMRLASQTLRARGLPVSSRICPLNASIVGFLLAAGSVGLSTRDALADVSSWINVGGGLGLVHGFEAPRQIVPTLRLGTGMGTDPSHSWVLGGMARVDTWFGHGADLSLMLRVANHGFVNGDWGVAFDLGPTARFWGPNVYGVAGAVTLGGPWGLEAGLNASLGNERLSSYGCFIGIDLARLTAYRRSGRSYWKNTFPVYRTPEDEAH
jgi:hypothetical protein